MRPSQILCSVSLFQCWITVVSNVKRSLVSVIPWRFNKPDDCSAHIFSSLFWVDNPNALADPVVWDFWQLPPAWLLLTTYTETAISHLLQHVCSFPKTQHSWINIYINLYLWESKQELGCSSFIGHVHTKKELQSLSVNIESSHVSTQTSQHKTTENTAAYTMVIVNTC